MKHLDSYNFYLVNESFDIKLYENKVYDTYKEIQKDLSKKIGFQLYLVGTFQMGIVALCPVVEALMKNSQIDVTKQQIVLLVIFAVTQILNLLSEDVERIRKELEKDGLIHLVSKVKESILSIHKLFSFVARGFGKIIHVFTDLFAYISLAMPLYMVVIEMISKEGLNIDTLTQKLAILGLGVGTFTLKSIMKNVYDKIKKKNESLDHSDVDPYGEEDWNDESIFNIGDKVICIDDHPNGLHQPYQKYLENGKIYEIEDNITRGDSAVLKLCGVPKWWNVKRFNKI